MRKKSPTKRNAILQAAFTVLCDKGYYETRIEDVARMAGVAKGTLYLYFKDKPDLYLGIIRWLLTRARVIVQEVAEKPETAQEQLRLVVNRWLAALPSRPGAVEMVFPELGEKRCEIARRFHQEVMPQMHRLVDAIARLIRRGINQGEFRKVNHRLAALSFLNAFRSAMLVKDGHIGIRASPQQALDIFFYGIKADE